MKPLRNDTLLPLERRPNHEERWTQQGATSWEHMGARITAHILADNA